MKRTVKIFALIMFFAAGFLTLNALEVTDYIYKFDSGMKVEVENGWNFTRVHQQIDSLDEEESCGLKISFKEVGDLISGESRIKIMSTEGDTAYPWDEKMEYYELSPGTYNISCKLQLQTRNGYIGFNIPGAVVKETMKTHISVVINDVQVLIRKEADNANGLGTYRTETRVYKNAEEGGPTGYPKIYPAGNHSAEISPLESPNDITHRVKPGIYDLFVEIDISWAGYKYRVWLNNFELIKDIRKTAILNLNGSEITVNCEDECPSMIHFYPRGTADKLGLKEDKSKEIYSLESPKGENPCPGGTYDILLNYGYGSRYEWRKAVNCEVGTLTIIEVK